MTYPLTPFLTATSSSLEYFALQQYQFDRTIELEKMRIGFDAQSSTFKVIQHDVNAMMLSGRTNLTNVHPDIEKWLHSCRAMNVTLELKIETAKVEADKEIKQMEIKIAREREQEDRSIELEKYKQKAGVIMAMLGKYSRYDIGGAKQEWRNYTRLFMEG